ncbi:unnamed protein product [Dicrocoelium dendriticum]|nr:unnamed protein product [Dicrocoelium dendriticum]
MSRLLDQPKEHECNLKKKLAELAEEVSIREDDVRHPSVFNQYNSNKMKIKPAAGDACRESLSTLELLPVSAHKARWEQLMATKRTEHPQSSLVKTRMAQFTGRTVPSANSYGKYPPALTPKPGPADVARSTLSQAERERLERQAELEELRRMRRRPLEEIHGTVAMHHSSSATSLNSVKSPRTDDFTLPPAPSPTRVTETTVCDTGAVSPPHATLEELSRCHDSPENPSPSRETEETVVPEVSKFQSDFDEPADAVPVPSEDDIPLDVLASSREYYSRPKFCANRAGEKVSTEQLPRQRSVTFEPALGTAPGDTTSEGTIDSDVGSLYCSTSHSAPSPSTALDTCVRPSSDTTRFVHDRDSDEISGSCKHFGLFFFEIHT